MSFRFPCVRPTLVQTATGRTADPCPEIRLPPFLTVTPAVFSQPPVLGIRLRRLAGSGYIQLPFRTNFKPDRRHE